MKRLLFSGFLVLAYLNCTAQKIRFTDTSNKWSLLALYQVSTAGYSGIPVSMIGWASDTSIAGRSYRRFSYGVDGGNYAGPYGIREDTTAGRIYFRFLQSNIFGSAADAMERLFFDYHFKKGDTLKMDFGGRQQWHYVSSVDSVSINGKMHKTWRMYVALTNSAMTNMQPYTFVEGIGCLGGPGWMVFCWAHEQYAQLRCFYNKGTKPTIFPAQRPLVYFGQPQTPGYIQVDSFDNSISCNLTPAAVEDLRSQRIAVVTPNPGGRNMILNLSNGFNAGSLQIYNMTGQLIQTIHASAGKVAIGQYLSLPGVYTYVVQDAATGSRYSGRFLYQ